jgi:3-hydroxy-9,10-secoandrosta-1,3,5(10)-triene-9,17-dione monooxygenase reductase component
VDRSFDRPAASSEEVDPQGFRDAMSQWASGVSVVTATGPDGPTGMTVSSFSSLSLDPPLVLVCIAQGVGAHDALVDADGFAVHLLAQGQHELSDRFASRGIDKFAGLDYALGPYEAPLLEGGLVRLVCERYAAPAGGDHTILIGRVVRAETTGGEPLVHFDRAYRRLAAGGTPTGAT